ncbi:MAG: tetratricopeptide repeat protein [Candidatus Eremiobacteraeota bacterium]|nr:tetratricopeptide repeat protein [Candidatus Eremiobacteraeota bacterium]
MPTPVALVSDEAQVSDAIAFLENRVRHDPEDALAYNKLGGYYLQDLRETGALQYLDLMARAAHASLASVPVVRNTEGLSLLELTEFSTHEFARARNHALDLIRIDPAKEYPYEMLFDSEVELGHYHAAATAFTQMLRHSGGINANTETRRARLNTLYGDTVGAARHLSTAIALDLHLATPPREVVAWSYWQLGETAFNRGNYVDAEQYYRDALISFPGYFRALASLGRVRAARGDLQDGIVQYKAAIDVLPDPVFVAALGDLYALSGQKKAAADQYALVQAIGHLSTLAGVLYNRPLALFYADHDMKAQEAYANASREYAKRRDIYGADAVAWTALKAGGIKEARASIKVAMRLGTLDAKLFYHSGMIARAAGDRTTARNDLQRALELNPVFDPLQAIKARAALAAL